MFETKRDSKLFFMTLNYFTILKTNVVHENIYRTGDNYNIDVISQGQNGHVWWCDQNDFFFFIAFLLLFGILSFVSSSFRRSFKTCNAIRIRVRRIFILFVFDTTSNVRRPDTARKARFCSVVSDNRWAKSVPIGISYFGHIITSALNANNSNGLSSH